MALEDAWKKWKEKPEDEGLTDLLLEAKPVISSAIQNYAGKRDPVIELEAQRLSAEAFDSYDPKRGASLKTYLYSQLAPLKRITHERAQTVRIPPQAFWDMQNLERAESELKEKTGREPSARHLADATGLSLKRVSSLRSLRGAGIPETALTEGDPEAMLKQVTVDSNDRSTWWSEAVYHGLGERDQKIFDYRTGAHGTERLPNKDIAKKLGISAAAVSQRASKIADQLKQVMETSG